MRSWPPSSAARAEQLVLVQGPPHILVVEDHSEVGRRLVAPRPSDPARFERPCEAVEIVPELARDPPATGVIVALTHDLLLPDIEGKFPRQALAGATPADQERTHAPRVHLAELVHHVGVRPGEIHDHGAGTV